MVLTAISSHDNVCGSSVRAGRLGIGLWNTNQRLRATAALLVRNNYRGFNQELEGAGPLFSTGTSFTPVRGHR